MKKLILCEGKRDSIFLNKLFAKLNVDPTSIKIFDQDERNKKDNIRYAETVELRRFLEKSNKRKILVKSEAGKDKALDLFSRNGSYCFTNKQITKTIIMLDLDSGPFEPKLKQIESKFLNKRAGDPLCIKFDKLKYNNNIYFFIVYNL